MDLEKTIPCQICGEQLGYISHTHLKSRHGMTQVEYRKKFHGAPLKSPAVDKRMRKGPPPYPKDYKSSFFGKRSERSKGSGNPFYGKSHSEETRKKLSAHFQGVAEEEWVGFSNPEYKREWKSKRAKRWSREIFERDDFTCLMCGKRGGNLEAHHIIPRSVDRARRYDNTNGATLCIPCHKSTFGKELEMANYFFDILNQKSRKGA